MAITANDVKTLRDRTNAPMMECKTALNETGGDMEKAVEWLRKKAGSKIGNFAARETAEGRIGIFLDPATKSAPSSRSAAKPRRSPRPISSSS